MASQATRIFMAYLESKEMKVQILDDETNLIALGLGLNNTQLRLFIRFGDDDSDVHLEGREFARIPSEQAGKALEICNSLNDAYRWVKFVWEENGDLACRCDGVIQLDSCAEETYELLARMAGIVDDAYPEIMKKLWA